MWKMNQEQSWYELKCGSRKKTFSDMSKVAFRIFIREETDGDNWKVFNVG